MNREEVIETMIAPLYLEVSGPTLDRIRIQLDRFLSQTPGEGEFQAGYLGETCELSFCPKFSDIKSLEEDKDLMDFINGIPASSVASVVGMAAEKYILQNPGLNNEKVDVTPELDAITLGLLRLYRDKRGELQLRDGKVLLAAVVGFKTLQKEDKMIFAAMWKKAGHGG